MRASSLLRQLAKGGCAARRLSWVTPGFSQSRRCKTTASEFELGTRGSSRDYLRKNPLRQVKPTDKPGSVVDSHSSRPAIAHWLKQPTRVQYGPYLMNPYLALLRVEFTVPRTVTSRAVRSYRTLSPLPDPACAGHRRFALCCTGRGFPPQALPGTLPYGARTFLPSARLPRRGRRRSGDCLVSFGAQYRGNRRPAGMQAWRNHGHSCFLCEIVIRSQFHTTYEPEA